MSVVITTNAGEVARALNLSARELRLVMDAGIRDAARYARRDYERLTATWQHKPDIIEEIHTRGGIAEAMVGTDDRIFSYVDQGTRPHIIKPKNALALRFLSGFRAKTTPGSLQSGAGGSYGDVLFRKFVRHPGTKPRKFTQKIQQRLDKYAPVAMNKQVRLWAAKGRK